MTGMAHRLETVNLATVLIHGTIINVSKLYFFVQMSLCHYEGFFLFHFVKIILKYLFSFCLFLIVFCRIKYLSEFSSGLHTWCGIQNIMIINTTIFKQHFSRFYALHIVMILSQSEILFLYFRGVFFFTLSVGFFFRNSKSKSLHCFHTLFYYMDKSYLINITECNWKNFEYQNS